MIKQNASDTSSLTQKFHALADPTRRAMLDRLVAGEATLSELAAPFDMTLPAVAKHLRVLEQSGLVVREEGTRQHCSRLAPAGFVEVGDWLARHHAFWGGGLKRLKTFIEAKANVRG